MSKFVELQWYFVAEFRKELVIFKAVNNNSSFVFSHWSSV